MYQDLRVAIEADASAGDPHFGLSEANHVIANWVALTEAQKQDVLNFLRGLWTDLTNEPEGTDALLDERIEFMMISRQERRAQTDR